MLFKVNDYTYVNSQNITHIDFAGCNVDKKQKYMVVIYTTHYAEDSINAGVYDTEKEAIGRINELVYMCNELPEFNVNMREV